jgi:hypothetical protein
MRLILSAYLFFSVMIPSNAGETLLTIFADVCFCSNFEKGWLIFNNNALKCWALGKMRLIVGYLRRTEVTWKSFSFHFIVKIKFTIYKFQPNQQNFYWSLTRVNHQKLFNHHL